MTGDWCLCTDRALMCLGPQGPEICFKLGYQCIGIEQCIPYDVALSWCRLSYCLWWWLHSGGAGEARPPLPPPRSAGLSSLPARPLPLLSVLGEKALAAATCYVLCPDLHGTETYSGSGLPNHHSLQTLPSA